MLKIGVALAHLCKWRDLEAIAVEQEPSVLALLAAAELATQSGIGHRLQLLTATATRKEALLDRAWTLAEAVIRLNGKLSKHFHYWEACRQMAKTRQLTLTECSHPFQFCPSW